MRLTWRCYAGCLSILSVASAAVAQPPLTWTDVRDRFRQTNPAVQAGRIGIDESKAAEITAYLRPNPQWSLTLDQIGNTQDGGPFAASNLLTSISYLRERDGKRELRRDSARGATAVTASEQLEFERTQVSALRSAFIQLLQAKAFQTLAHENLSSYDQVLAVSRGRLTSGNIAQIDLDRLELQRVTYESDVQTAEVNVRTAKIQLLRMLNDATTPPDRFDVSGPYDFIAPVTSVEECRRIALDTRPDLRAALESVDKARVDRRLADANGSADPTFTVDAAFPSISQVYLSYEPPLRQYVGLGVALPLRIFDRNQGEKLRTELDVSRNEKLADAARLQVIADVDTAYASVVSAVALLQPYKDRYLAEASRVRDTVQFSYQRGAASLVEFLQSQQEYRALQVGYVNLVAAYLNAANQLNLAVGREVLP